MVIPIIYRKSGESIVTYDFTDVVSQTGYITLYGLIDQDGAGVLSETAIASDDIETTATVNDANYALKIDKDFDITVNRPLTVGGIFTATIPATVYGQNDWCYIYATVKIRKYDGSSETEVASDDSAAMKNKEPTATNLDHDRMLTVRFTVPQTIYKKGEVLRITLLVYLKGNGAGTNQGWIAHDPTARLSSLTGAAFTTGMDTRLTFRLPIKLDL